MDQERRASGREIAGFADLLRRMFHASAPATRVDRVILRLDLHELFLFVRGNPACLHEDDRGC